jgi:uncharacterized protein with HEPN domain
LTWSSETTFTVESASRSSRKPCGSFDAGQTRILDSIDDYGAIVGHATIADLTADRPRRYAAERCVEIISEASRRIPEEWKAEHASIPWQEIAGIGSVIRHNYENTNPTVIIGLRGEQLAHLKTAVLALLEKYDPEGLPFRKRQLK